MNLLSVLDMAMLGARGTGPLPVPYMETLFANPGRVIAQGSWDISVKSLLFASKMKLCIDVYRFSHV